MTVDTFPDDAPAPRLCHLIKWHDFDGYGFNLHAERSNPGQFIGKIDDDSPADGYDPPPADPAWREMVTGSATGYQSGPGARIQLAAPLPAESYVDVGF